MPKYCNKLVELEQQNRTLQKIDELKTDFISLVSHERRALLTNISNGIELVLEDRGGLPTIPPGCWTSSNPIFSFT